MTKKFPKEMLHYRLEIEELILFNIKKQMGDNTGIAIKALEGMFIGLREILRGNNYTAEEMKELYIYSTSGLHMIKEVKNYKIIKQCLLLLQDHFDLFEDFLLKNEQDIISLLFTLIRKSNRKIKEGASDCFEALFEHISKRSVTSHQKQLVEECTVLLKKRMKVSIDPVEVMVCVRCYGLLSKAIVACFGSENLENHFLLLLEISENKVLRKLGEYEDEEEDLELKAENFKKLLYRQKQLNSHIIAFAHIVNELTSLKEDQAKHILQIFMLGVSIHASVFEGYKVYLYKALVLMVNSMYKQNEMIFKFWLKKVVK
jgi:hypothetical protein